MGFGGDWRGSKDHASITFYGPLILVAIVLAALFFIWMTGGGKKVSPPQLPRTTAVQSLDPNSIIWDPNDLSATARAICPDCGEAIRVIGKDLVFFPFHSLAEGYWQQLSDCRNLPVPKGVIAAVHKTVGKPRAISDSEFAMLRTLGILPMAQILRLADGTILQVLFQDPVINAIGATPTGVVCFARFSMSTT